MYEKEWFILVDGVKEGPYSLLDLRRDRRITPDTLAWKPGLDRWFPIRKIKELKKLFEDDERPEEESIEEGKRAKSKLPEVDTLALRYEPPFFWMFVVLVAIVYVLYQLLIVRH